MSENTNFNAPAFTSRGTARSESVTLEQAKKQLFELDAWIDQAEKVIRAQAGAQAKPAARAVAR